MKLSLVECFPMIQQAWDLVKQQTIINCWRKTTLLNNIQDLVNDNYIFHDNGLPEDDQKRIMRERLTIVKPNGDKDIQPAEINQNNESIEIEMETSQKAHSIMNELKGTLGFNIDRKNFISPIDENDIPLDFESNDENEIPSKEEDLSFDISKEEIKRIFGDQKQKISQMNLNDYQKKIFAEQLLDYFGLKMEE